MQFLSAIDPYSVGVTILFGVVLCWLKNWYTSREPVGFVNPVMQYKTVRALDPIESMMSKIEKWHGLSQTHTNLISGPVTFEVSSFFLVLFFYFSLYIKRSMLPSFSSFVVIFLTFLSF